MNDLESAEKISIDIKKLERNLKQVEDINFEGKEKEVYDRAVDYMNDSKDSWFNLNKKSIKFHHLIKKPSPFTICSLKIKYLIYNNIKKSKKKAEIN